MKKRQTILVFGALASVVLAYFTWTCWPRSVQVEWHSRIDEKTRSVAEDYLKQHPLQATPNTWGRLWNNIITPNDLYRDRAVVTLMKYSDGTELVQLNYLEREVSIRCLEDGTWEEVNPDDEVGKDTVPYIGRMFERRVE
ncbi:MAG: hypothetical protein ACSHX6_07305 [Akkermansiaceae bacterium]